eukprot:c27911_g1_i2 orf=359-1345(+)
MAANVTGVYLHVVEDVINNVRADFESEGVDESVLSELQALWELKMMQSGAIQSTAETFLGKGGTVPITPVHDLNVPYEATEEYETPTAEMLFPPTPLINTAEPVMYQYFPPGPSEPTISQETGMSGDVKLGRPALHMQQPAPWMNQKPLGVDVNIAYEEGRDEETETSQPPITKDFFTLSAGKRKREDFAPEFLSGSYIPQQDGAGDCEPTLASPTRAAYNCQGVAEEDYNEPSEEEPQFANDVEVKAFKGERVEADESEPPLNEDDDEDADDFYQGDEEPKTDHLVVAQFEKVTRSKNKWKCILKDGVMHLDQRDHLFSKANGEFEF